MNLPGPIVIITPGFPIDESDTNCLPSQQLFVRSVNKLFPNIKIIVVSLQHPSHKTSYVWFGNMIVPLNGKSYGSLLKPLFWRSAINRIIKIAKQENATALISFWCQETALIGMHVSKQLKISHKIWISGQDARKGNHWMKLMKPSSEMLVAMSDFLQDEFQKNYHVRPEHVIRNGVDQSLFSNPVQPREIDIIGVGSLIGLKQYDKFLEVVERIKMVRPDVKAVLAGNGRERDRLKEQIMRKNLSDTIRLYGELPHQEAIQLMERSKILLHPSSYEGYSTVCLEALYAGCQVVSFTFAENKKIPNWTIVEDVSQMTKTTLKLLASENSLTRILVNSMDHAASDFIDLLSREQ